MSEWRAINEREGKSPTPGIDENDGRSSLTRERFARGNYTPALKGLASLLLFAAKMAKEE